MEQEVLTEAGVQAFLSQQAKALFNLTVKEEVTSTNTVLVRQAQQGEPEGTVLIAQRQTAGKGRRGRSFYSPEGTGLYMSLLLRPKLSPQDSLLVTTAAAVAVSRAIEKVSGETALIKWVNDIYCRDKKVVGILVEGGMQPEKEMLAYAVLGIGINLWPPTDGFDEELSKTAGSVMRSSDEGRGKQLLCRLAAAVLNEWAEWGTELTEKRFMPEYRRRSFLVGQTVRVLNATHEVLENYPPVKVLGIGDEAELIVELPDGRREKLRSGEVSVRI